GVVQQRHLDVGVEPGQGLLQTVGEAAGVGHEGLHLRLAELRPAGADEAAAEALGPRHADRRSVDRQDDGVALQHGDADALQDARHLKALNAGDETPGDIAYISVYSRTDQFVWRTDGAKEPWTESAKLDGASNIAIQDVCPGRYVEHIQATYDAAVFAVIMDALTHDGGADAGRVDRSVCAQAAMPGVDMGKAMAETLEI